MKKLTIAFLLAISVVITLLAFDDRGGGAPEGSQAITTGTTTTLNNDAILVRINPATTLASHTITMAAAPIDRQTVYIFCGGTIASGAVVTTFSLVANSGQALVQVSAPTSLTFGDCLVYMYSGSDSKWLRLK